MKSMATATNQNIDHVLSNENREQQNEWKKMEATLIPTYGIVEPNKNTHCLSLLFYR